MTVERLLSGTVVAALAWTPRRRPDRHVLVAAPGGGSVGDQAMFESFVSGTSGGSGGSGGSGTVVVVVRQASDLLGVPEPLRDRVEVLPLPGLLYGGIRAHLRDLVRLSLVLRRSRSVSVVGADVMDGVYSVLASVRRFWVPAFAARAGLDGRVLGFSWNSHPAPLTVDAMRWASRRVRLLARDPGSAARLRADGGHGVVDVADLAFLMTPGTTPAPIRRWLQAQRAAGRTVVAVNANYLLQDRVDQVAEYSRLVADRLGQGWSFLLLPHDSRGAPSDVDLARAIRDAAPPSEHVHLVPGVLAPGEVTAVMAEVDLAVTGRMHLAILAAVAGTPAVAVSYQGKIAGLYDRLGLPCVLEPDERFRASLDDVADRVVGELAGLRETLARTVPQVRELALLNLPAPRQGAAGTATGTTAAPVRVVHSFRATAEAANPFSTLTMGAMPTGVQSSWFTWRRALLGRYDVLHVHWPELLLRSRSRTGRVLRWAGATLLLGRLAVTRTPVVRTLHNTAPHELRSPVERAFLHRFDAVTTRWVHMAESHGEGSSRPAAVIPHGHYRTWYPQPGGAPRPGRLLYFGLIRPYKDVPVLIDRFAGLPQDADVSLRVVGSLRSPELRDEIERAAAADERVDLSLRFVPDDELAAEVAEAELVVLPYRRMDNSGALLLALSLDRPALVPATPSTCEIAREVGPGWVLTYDGSLRTEHLADALAQVRAGGRGDRPDLSRREWDHVGALHETLYRELVG